MADFDINAHLAQMGFGNKPSGGGGASGGDGIANEKESPEIILKGADKAAGTVAKLIGSAAPIPINFGEVSALAGLEVQEGQHWASKPMNQAGGNMALRGGMLYNLIFAPLIKDGSIKDMASDVLSSPGFQSASMDFGDSGISAPMDFGGSGNFMALGDLPPPLPIEAMAISAPGRGGDYSPDF